MRLFVALDIDADIRERIAEFRNQMRPLAPDVRWVGPETFHVTLQFLGETKKLDEIQQALRQVKGSPIAARVSQCRVLPESEIAAGVLGRYRV